MIDYLLKFESKQVAEQFGIANGFAAVDEEGIIQTSLASHTHALCEIGPHNESDYWVLFRDLVGIPVPAGAEAFIYWCSDWSVTDDSGQKVLIPRPEFNVDVPNVFWA